MASVSDFFNETEKQNILNAIQNAEAKTSGEIRLHIEKKCKGNVLDRAANLFSELKMNETRERNGILFYLAIESHDFAIIGDKGIHERVHQEFWEQLRDETIYSFKAKEFSKGLIQSILRCGEELKKYFPANNHDNPNELSNEISVS
jgi:uncharacterized membrane protein